MEEPVIQRFGFDNLNIAVTVYPNGRVRFRIKDGERYAVREVFSKKDGDTIVTLELTDLNSM